MEDDEKHKVEYIIEEDDHYKIISERRFDIYTSTWNKDKEIRTTKLTNSIPFPIYSFRDISDFLIINKRISFLELNITQKTYFADKISLLDAKNEMKKKKLIKMKKLNLKMKVLKIKYIH